MLDEAFDHEVCLICRVYLLCYLVTSKKNSFSCHTSHPMCIQSQTEQYVCVLGLVWSHM